MRIDRKLIDYVANLSRLKLTEEEKQREERDLDKIFVYMDKLEELDTQDVQPLTHIFQVKNVLREDCVEPAWERETLLKNAPKQKKGCFQVPKTVE